MYVVDPWNGPHFHLHLEAMLLVVVFQLVVFKPAPDSWFTFWRFLWGFNFIFNFIFIIYSIHWKLSLSIQPYHSDHSENVPEIWYKSLVFFKILFTSTFCSNKATNYHFDFCQLWLDPSTPACQWHWGAGWSLI